jgi:hypothetical protein
VLCRASFCYTNRILQVAPKARRVNTKSILSALSKTSLKELSDLMVESPQISWTDALINVLAKLDEECGRLINRFVDRDESVISAMEHMAQEGRVLRCLLEATSAYPLSESFKTDVPPTHIDFFRRFLLGLEQSISVIRAVEPS